MAEKIKQAEEAIKERVLTKEGMAGKGRASESDRNYKPPEIDWKNMLKRFLGRYLKRKTKRNVRRPSNRYDEIFKNSNVFIPSNKGYVETPKINVYLDISGSMHGIISNVRSILEEAKRYFKQYKGKYYI